MTKRVSLAFIHAEIVELDLDPFTLKIYLYLQHRCNSKGFSFLNAKTIAKETRISETKTKEALRELATKRLIHRVTYTKPEGGSASKYYLTDRNEWLANGDSDTKEKTTRRVTSRPVRTNPTGHLPTSDGSPPDPSVYKERKPFSKSPNNKGKTKFQPADLLPEEWRNSKEFLEAWDGWVEARPKAAGKTERAAKLASSRLANGRTTIAEAIQHLEEATQGGWRGLYPAKKIDKSQQREFEEPETRIKML